MITTSFYQLNIRAFVLATMLGVITTALPEAVYGQKAPNIKGADKPVLEGTLAEASVVSKLWASAYEVEPLKLQLNLINPHETKARVGIRNNKNELIFHDTFSKGYNRMLNLSPLQPGFYGLHVYCKKDYISHYFKIQSTLKHEITLANSVNPPASDLIHSIYKTEPTKFVVVLANPSGKRVNILIRNQKNEVIFQMYGSGQQIAKSFDMATLKDGKYTMVVKDKVTRISQEFEIKRTDEHTLAWVDKRGRPLNSEVATKTNTSFINLLRSQR